MTANSGQNKKKNTSRNSSKSTPKTTQKNTGKSPMRKEKILAKRQRKWYDKNVNLSLWGKCTLMVIFLRN